VTERAYYAIAADDREGAHVTVRNGAGTVVCTLQIHAHKDAAPEWTTLDVMVPATQVALAVAHRQEPGKRPSRSVALATPGKSILIQIRPVRNET